MKALPAEEKKNKKWRNEYSFQVFNNESLEFSVF